MLVDTEYVANDFGLGWERISLLGSMIKNLIVVTGMCCDDKCEQAIGKCIDLESLFVIRDYAGEEEGIESCSNVTCLLSIFSSSLRYFEHHGFIAAHPIFDTLSSALRNLRYLALDLLKPIENGIDFKPIALSNPHLSSVRIQEWPLYVKEREKELSIEILGVLVNAFSKCRSIYFTLGNHGEESVTRDEIQDICGALPCRGVHLKIQVGSVCYQQTYRQFDFEEMRNSV